MSWEGASSESVVADLYQMLERIKSDNAPAFPRYYCGPCGEDFLWGRETITHWEDKHGFSAECFNVNYLKLLPKAADE